MTELLGVDATLQALVACVCEGLEQEDRPACVCSTTIGTPAIANPCECSPGVSGELWGNLVRVYRTDRVTLNQATQPRRPCAPAEWAAEYILTLARCFPTVDEDGELPDPEERAESASILHSDVAAMYRSIHCCPDIEPADIVSIDVATEPQGGASYLTATVHAPISLSAAKNALP